MAGDIEKKLNPTTQPENFSNPIQLISDKLNDPCEATVDQETLEQDLIMLEEWKQQAMDWEQDNAQSITNLKLSLIKPRGK